MSEDQSSDDHDSRPALVSLPSDLTSQTVCMKKYASMGDLQSIECSHPATKFTPASPSTTDKHFTESLHAGEAWPVEIIGIVLDHLLTSYEKAPELTRSTTPTWIVQIMPQKPPDISYSLDYFKLGTFERHRVILQDVPGDVKTAPGLVNDTIKSIYGLAENDDRIFPHALIDTPRNRCISLRPQSFRYQQCSPESMFLNLVLSSRLIQEAAYRAIARARPTVQIHGPGLPNWNGRLAPLKDYVETVSIYPFPHPGADYQPLVDECRRLRHIVLGKTEYWIMREEFIRPLDLFEEASSGLLIGEHTAYENVIKLCRDQFPNITTSKSSTAVTILLPIMFRVSLWENLDLGNPNFPPRIPSRNGFPECLSFVMAQPVMPSRNGHHEPLPTYPIHFDITGDGLAKCLNELPILWDRFSKAIRETLSQSKIDVDCSASNEKLKCNEGSAGQIPLEVVLCAMTTNGFEIDRSDRKLRNDWNTHLHIRSQLNVASQTTNHGRSSISCFQNLPRLDMS